MDKEELKGRLKEIAEKEQEIFGMYTRLAEEVEDPDLKDLLGWIAHEVYSHLSTILDMYRKLLDEQG